MKFPQSMTSSFPGAAPIATLCAHGVTPRNGKNCTLRVAVSEEMTHGIPADSRPLGDLPLADTLLKEPFHLGGMPGDRPRPSVRTALFAGLGDPGLHAIAEDVPLEFGE